MSDLVHIYVRADATGPVAKFADQRVTPWRLTRREAEAILRATPNGRQLELRPAEADR